MTTEEKDAAMLVHLENYLRAFYGKTFDPTFLIDALLLRDYITANSGGSDDGFELVEVGVRQDPVEVFKGKVFGICIEAMRSGDATRLRKMADAFESVCERTSPDDAVRTKLLKDPMRITTSTIGEIREWLEIGNDVEDKQIWRFLKSVGFDPAPAPKGRPKKS